MKKLILIAALIALTACSDADEGPNVTKTPTAAPGRFTLIRVQDFRDTNAYNSVRSVYLMVDNKTGKEYVGVSGVGISELGSHPAGKTNTSDER